MAPPPKRKREDASASAATGASDCASCSSCHPPCSPPPASPPPPPAQTFHRRALPDECVAFSSDEGRRLFADAIAGSFMRVYFPLAEQFTTQAEPAFCGLATLAMCLNALHIDPGRLWKGSWRWFSEELLDCCTPLSVAKQQGVSFAQFVCLARCNGALARGVRADSALSLDAFREYVKRSCASSDELVVLNYTRKALAQTGDGHFSPVGGYNEASDMLLLLDVARFKYPPHWVRLPLVFEALQCVDTSSGLPRGLVLLSENKDMSGPTPANQLIQARAMAALNEEQAAYPTCCSSAAAVSSAAVAT
ncbi:hypothetical protein PybrP1_003595 [[Pythium] brassicae (nom. inval.)]|nr:hypothetical protein PybrP1_003595 [[Pythium] brassicae (nom. inval.)]